MVTVKSVLITLMVASGVTARPANSPHQGAGGLWARDPTVQGGQAPATQDHPVSQDSYSTKAKSLKAFFSTVGPAVDGPGIQGLARDSSRQLKLERQAARMTKKEAEAAVKRGDADATTILQRVKEFDAEAKGMTVKQAEDYRDSTAAAYAAAQAKKEDHNKMSETNAYNEHAKLLLQRVREKHGVQAPPEEAAEIEKNNKMDDEDKAYAETQSKEEKAKKDNKEAAAKAKREKEAPYTSSRGDRSQVGGSAADYFWKHGKFPEAGPRKPKISDNFFGIS